MNNSTFADQLLLLFVEGLIRSYSIETKRKFYSGARDIRMRETDCTHGFTAFTVGVKPRFSQLRLNEIPKL